MNTQNNALIPAKLHQPVSTQLNSYITLHQYIATMNLTKKGSIEKIQVLLNSKLTNNFTTIFSLGKIDKRKETLLQSIEKQEYIKKNLRQRKC